jgi:membrane-associated PAP2 superfamily phosphatase
MTNAARALDRQSSTAAALWHRDLRVCLVTLAALLAWDASGLDRAAVRLFGDAQGFAWRDHWLTRGVLHEGGRALGWTLFAVLVVGIWRPMPFARSLPRSVRVWWVLSTLVCVAAIPVFKHFSHTSCPWSLAEFGGTASYLSHWTFGTRDGGPGGCFPSGHASGAFAFLSGWFALRLQAPRAARGWLAGTLVFGLLFGLAQMARGAHYPSHTLWTAWICLALLTALSGLRPELRRTAMAMPVPTAG